MSAKRLLLPLKITGGILIGLLLAFAGCLVFWPSREALPAQLLCSGCGDRILKVQGGLAYCGGNSSSRRLSFPDGSSCIVDGEPGNEHVRGGCVSGWDYPSWICRGCGKCWYHDRRPWPRMLVAGWRANYFGQED